MWLAVLSPAETDLRAVIAEIDRTVAELRLALRRLRSSRTWTKPTNRAPRSITPPGLRPRKHDALWRRIDHRRHCRRSDRDPVGRTGGDRPAASRRCVLSVGRRASCRLRRTRRFGVAAQRRPRSCGHRPVRKGQYPWHASNPATYPASCRRREVREVRHDCAPPKRASWSWYPWLILDDGRRRGHGSRPVRQPGMKLSKSSGPNVTSTGWSGCAERRQETDRCRRSECEVPDGAKAHSGPSALPGSPGAVSAANSFQVGVALCAER